MKKISFVLTAVLGLGLLFNAPAQFLSAAPAPARLAAPLQNARAPLGVNVSLISSLNTDLPFVDYFKASTSWLPQCYPGSPSPHPACTWDTSWDTGEYDHIDLDAAGWVRSLPAPADGYIFDRVSTALFAGGPALDITGTYLVLYDGLGTIEYSQGAVKDESASQPGRDVINYSPTEGGFLITLVATDPGHTGNYIRNIRVVRPQDEFSTEMFNARYLNELRHFKVLRYMDTMATNNNEGQGEWANRPKGSDIRYSECRDRAHCPGVPLEVMIRLSNDSGTAPWFTLPHKATDEYFTQFATLVRDQLDPRLPVYVEYSNEVWNAGFEQGNWVAQQAAAEWPTTPDNWDRRSNWYGKRVAQMCDIWETVWGAQAQRVICVAGGPPGGPYADRQILDCPYWEQGPCVNHNIDALAISPYFGGYLGGVYTETLLSWAALPDGGLNNIFTELTVGGVLPPSSDYPADGALQESLRWMRDTKAVADEFGVKLIAYEGGQHLTPYGEAMNDERLVTMFANANRDERMYPLYLDYLRGWKESGGELFTAYSFCGGYSKWGSWGAMEYINQPNTPKYRALLDFMAQNPCWWSGCGSSSLYLPLVRR